MSPPLTARTAPCAQVPVNETGLADLPLDQARQAYKASIIILSVMEEHLHDAPTEVWEVAIRLARLGVKRQLEDELRELESGDDTKNA